MNSLKSYLGLPNILLFNTAHAALYFLLKELRTIAGERNEVVLPGFTCTVVVDAIRQSGYRPVFADVELDTFGLDIDSLRHAVNAKTAFVLLHHLFGIVSKHYGESDLAYHECSEE